MTCERIKIGDGYGFVCSRGKPRKPKCVSCGAEATLLCDYEIRPGKTCDAPICESCATSPADEIDYCPEHAEGNNQRQLELRGP